MPGGRYAHDKGRDTENIVARYYHAHGYPHAERRRLRGDRDAGDLTGIATNRVHQVKSALAKIAVGLDMVTDQAANAGVPGGIVIARRRGRPDPREWAWVVPLRVGIRIERLLDDHDLDPWEG